MKPVGIQIRVLTVIVLAMLGLAFQQTAQGQAVYGTKVRPSGAPHQPKLSPYLNLFRTDNSLLSPYHSFVQPSQELQQHLSRQERQINHLQQASADRQWSSQSNPDKRQPTGRGASFNNYLHYYRFDQRLPTK